MNTMLRIVATIVLVPLFFAAFAVVFALLCITTPFVIGGLLAVASFGLPMPMAIVVLVVTWVVCASAMCARALFPGR